MSGIFIFIAVLAAVAILWTLYVVPPETPEARDLSRQVKSGMLGEVLRNPDLLRLNFGIFTLHMAQMSLFLVVPRALVDESGIAVGDHWMVYLPAVLLALVLLLALLLALS